ncbi:ABC transporter permease subunit [Natrialba sp. SSL1]|uniref:ABC transporter permease subunit n=1 Tax=Natrialba sp. SSL1 TaxID=1869245 RepID=UPI0008F80CEF|nr:ABC transporter permease subunit [Natrialba sp. SSL1]OIB55330.1 copper ABC transporter permease [Natrialba sp. SSL1]
MSATLQIARAEVTDAVRSRVLWVVTAVLGLFVVTRLWLYGDLLAGTTYPFLSTFDTFAEFVPLLVIILGYRAVVGERDSGRIRLLLGQPGHRRDIVTGKYVGRAATLLAVVLAVALLLLAFVVAQFGTDGPTEIVGGLAVIILYTFAWLGVTVGVSSTFASETRVIGILIGLYALCVVLWDNLVISLVSLVVTGQAETGVDPLAGRFATLEEPTWFLYANRLNPLHAFDGARYYVPDLLDIAFVGGTTTAPHAPNLFGLGVLLAWATVPFLVGYWRFQRADLD